MRAVRPGQSLRLCTCGRSPEGPDCPATCEAGLELRVRRQGYLSLCRCGRSADLPYCDGSHAPATVSWRERWRRFRQGAE
ncbi:CDGSH iron-sulfur domain-containing protein [Pseudomonas alcaligenes]|uniref:CDGSH iron-sulfur domain-containing protein n=1 Tax=Pseudomonas sp. RIT-PI-AD TaxID=3035294 RepID=UPI0021DA955F